MPVIAADEKREAKLEELRGLAAPVLGDGDALSYVSPDDVDQQIETLRSFKEIAGSAPGPTLPAPAEGVEFNNITLRMNARVSRAAK
jgi:hypothetical protein